MTISEVRRIGGSAWIAVLLRSRRRRQHVLDQLRIPLAAGSGSTLITLSPDRLTNELGPMTAPTLTYGLASA